MASRFQKSLLTSINLTLCFICLYFLRRGPKVLPDPQRGPWHKEVIFGPSHKCNDQARLIWRYIYWLFPWCRVLLDKLTGLQPVKKFPAFHGTRKFITALTSVRHLSLSWASPIQSIYPHPTSWRSILILSTILHLGLPSGLLPSGFPTKTLHTPLSSPTRATCPAQINETLLPLIKKT